MGSAPRSSRSLRIAGSFSTFTSVPFSLSTIRRGRPAGPIQLNPLLTTKPGTPASCIVGTSGTVGERDSPHCAIMRSRPARTFEITTGMLAIVICT